MSVHSVCLSYKFRVSEVQLSEFAKLSYNEKLKMVDANSRLMAANNGKRRISYYCEVLRDLGLPDKPSSLRNIEGALVSDFKAKYSALLSKYNGLFTKVVTENERKLFGGKLINPNTLHLFEDSAQLLRPPNADLLSKYKSNNP
jgi:hypothetical protein